MLRVMSPRGALDRSEDLRAQLALHAADAKSRLIGGGDGQPLSPWPLGHAGQAIGGPLGQGLAYGGSD